MLLWPGLLVGATVVVFLVGALGRRVFRWSAWVATGIATLFSLLLFFRTVGRQTPHFWLRALVYPLGGLLAFTAIRSVKPRTRKPLPANFSQ